jgi:hypothetical protein
MMKKMKIYQKTGFFLAAICIAMFSCLEDFDSITSNPAEASRTTVENIVMFVGGKQYEGKTNEKTKQIHFRYLDLTGQDSTAVLSNVIFDGDFSRGARFDQDSYDFTFAEGEAENTRTIAVVNQDRKREYFVTPRLRMPPPGIDLTKAKATNFADNCRMADVDMEHVLVLSRDNPHLLRIEDLKSGVLAPIALNKTGMTDGLIAGAVNNGGGIQNGHAYCCSWGNPFKIYHWRTDQPDEPPTVIASISASTLPDPTVSRFSDQVSVNLNNNGRGYIYTTGRIGALDIRHALRVGITGWTNASSPVLLPLMNADGTDLGFSGKSGSSNYWPTFNVVDESSSEVLYGGNYAEVKLMDNDLKVEYRWTSFGVINGTSPRIIHFNGVRYLACLNGGGSSNTTPPGIIAIYNLKEGKTTMEALELFAENPAEPVFTCGIGGGTADNSAYLGYAKDDNMLYLVGSAGGGGFAFVELPKPAEVDPNDTSDTFFDELGTEFVITNIE